MGILITLGLIVLAARSFINAIKDDRPAKAIVFAVIIAFLLVLCANGGFVGIGSGVDVDYGLTTPPCRNEHRHPVDEALTRYVYYSRGSCYGG